jgi:acetyl esterase
VVITAEIDVLTDEARAYAKRLEQAGVPTRYTCYRGTIHPFMNFVVALDMARDGIAEVSAALRSAFGN